MTIPAPSGCHSSIVTPWIAALSAIGGFARFVERARSGQLTKPWPLELLRDILYAMLAGIAAWNLGLAAGWCDHLVAGITLIAAEAGSKLVEALEAATIGKVLEIIGAKRQDPPPPPRT